MYVKRSALHDGLSTVVVYRADCDDIDLLITTSVVTLGESGRIIASTDPLARAALRALSKSGKGKTNDR